MINDHVDARLAWAPLAPVIWGVMVISDAAAHNGNWLALILGALLIAGGVIGLFFSLRWWKEG